MKRITFPALLIGIFLLILTACNGVGNESRSSVTNTLQTADEASGSQQAVTLQNDNSQTETLAQAGTQDSGDGSGNGAEAVDSPNSNQLETSVEAASKAESDNKDYEGSATKSIGIIAESDNVVSGEDNGEVMKELEKELDALFTSINRLEDVDGAE